MTHAALLTETRDLHFGDEGSWAHGEVTPARDDKERRWTDASKLSFPLQLVIMIAGAIVTITLAVTGAFWLTTSTLRSDVRDILTRMEMSSRLDQEKSDSQKIRDAALHEQINSLGTQISAGERRQELLRLEFQQLREQVLFGKKGVK